MADLNPTISVDLPFPPSTNRYYRKWNNRMVIGMEGRRFKAAVAKAWGKLPKTDLRVLVGGLLYPPDHKRRDLDNFFGKALFDSLKGLAYDDDSQVYGFMPTGWVIGPDGRKVTKKGGLLHLVVQWLPTKVMA